MQIFKSRKFLLLANILILMVLYGTSKFIQANQRSESMKTDGIAYSYGHVLNDRNEPSPELTMLLKLLDVPHDGTLKSVVDATQKAWIRPAGSERWHLKETKVIGDKLNECWTLFDAMGLCQEKTPEKTKYDYAVVLGGTVNRVRSRLGHLFKQWDQGVRFKKLLFLVSDRQLDTTVESHDVILDAQKSYFCVRADWHFKGVFPTTEHEMGRLVFDQAKLPADFDAEIEFINTPNQTITDGTMRRANTGDTLKTWLATNPKVGSCLFVSNQPYIGYQDSVVRTYVPGSFAIETVGHKIVTKENVATILDTIARWLYQEQIRISSR